MKTRSLAPYAWMLAGCFLFTWMAACASQLGRLGCDWRIVTLARSLLAFGFALALARLCGAKLVFTKPPVLWMRSIAGSVSMLCTFFAFGQLRPSEVLTLTNTFPIWVAVLSWPLLRIRPAVSVWVGAVCGVAGVVLMQFSQLEDAGFAARLAAPLALAAAFTSAIAMLGLNKLRDIHPWAIVAHFSGVASLFAIGSCFVGPAVSFDHVLEPNVALLLLGVGVTATAGQLCLTRAFTAGEPARVSIVGLTQIVFMIALELVLNPRSFDLTTLAGIALVMAPTAWVMAGRVRIIARCQRITSIVPASPRQESRSMNDQIKQAAHGVTDQKPWTQSTISDDIGGKSERRPLMPLLLVALGAILYLVGWSITYLPGVIPIPVAINATMWGPMACVLLLAMWWIAFGRRMRLLARIGLTMLIGAIGVGSVFAAQNDTRFWVVIWGLPAAVAAMTLASWVFYHASVGLRTSLAVGLTLAALVPGLLVRVEGVTGEFGMNPSWRWTPTGEQQLADFLAKEGKVETKEVVTFAPLGEGDWPGFRGADRQGVVKASMKSDLVEKWRRPVGPGWGSVSGVGDRIFTQEQRDGDEVTACYALKTGKPIWTHTETARHNDGPSGPGPRATPTFHEGMLYVQGATGILARLDAATGKPDWTVDLVKDLELKPLVFGFSGSPLVHDGKVYICPGTDGPLLMAFDPETGKKLWQVGEQKGQSYSSPQLARLGGVEQILAFAVEGLTAHDPATGQELWKYEWKTDDTAQACLQPMLLPGDRIVLGAAQVGNGMRCLKVAKEGSSWSVSVAWQTKEVTPRFNDIVLRDGHIFGLDSGRVFCVNAADGKLVWKTRAAAFASGQVLLVGDRLLVQAERGFAAWIDAKTDAPAPKFDRFDAMNDKTWNHPAAVNGFAIVRNGKEMVCFGPKGD